MKTDHFFEEKWNFHFLKNTNKRRTKKYIIASDIFFLFFTLFLKNKNKKRQKFSKKVGPSTFSYK
jgi:hypothetical protein